MNWEAIYTVIAVLELLRGLLIYFLISPLRGLKEKVTELTNAGLQAAIKNLEQAHQANAKDIAALQIFRAGNYGEAVKIFTTREDWNRQNEHADRERRRMTDLIEQGLKNDAAQTKQLDLMQQQLNRLLEKS